MIDPVGGGLDEIASVLFAAADRVRPGGPLQLATLAGGLYIRELEAAVEAKNTYETTGRFFMDMIQGMLESGVNVDTPKNEVIDGYINGWTKQQRQIEELTAEVTKLREAICGYGLTICQTSGNWTLHDLSPAAEQEAAKTAEVQRLKAGKLTPEEFNELCHNLHETGQPMTTCAHEAACTAFRRVLFGTPAPSVADACHEHTSPD